MVKKQINIEEITDEQEHEQEQEQEYEQDNQTSPEVPDQEIGEIEFKKAKTPNFFSRHKIPLIITAIVLVLIGAGVAIYLLVLKPIWDQQPEGEAVIEEEEIVEEIHYYSKLSGEEISDESLNSLPIFCMQIPNGLDGARPQVGLAAAPIVFEALAEGGITRFAALFQGVNSGMIGPIRSLRLYYLEWDTPFDCTIVHAGGSTDALAAVRSGGYRDLSEDYSYMWRDYSAYWAPNNLFTSAALLNQFNTDHGYTTSDFTAPARLTPPESEQARLNAVEAAKPQTSTNDNGEEVETPGAPLVTSVVLRFGNGISSFDVNYVYDANSNSYLRSYASGEPHTSYLCPAELPANPRPQVDCGVATQLAPKVVVAILVHQSLNADGKRQDITTTGTGDAYIFQNGTATKATWHKPDKSTQFTFTNENGEEVKLAPGQAWITALPSGRGQVIY